LRLCVPGGRDAAARSAAGEIAAVLRTGHRARLLLAAGRTMAPVYAELASLHRRGRAPFARAETFNVDELTVGATDPRSFRAFMESHLFSKVDLPRDRIHFLRGDAADPDRECRRYERELEAAGPPDLALVGLGANGHVAYLEPGRVLPPRTSRVRLSAATRRRLAKQGMNPVPREALTMGLESILASRRILLVASGREKADILAAALEGPVTPRVPASFLSLHPALTVILDHSAASSLAR
jgi:glucosamine-6-phosphate deaminase